MQKNLHELTNDELWRLFPIMLSVHNSEWGKLYTYEEQHIKNIIGNKNIARINHIGSTSIDGLLAKPIIDILLEITSNCNLEKLIESLKTSGYIYSPQPNNPAPHMMFMKGYTPNGFAGQAFHLHVRYSGDWAELYFRDYLRVHKQAAEQYAELKKNLKEKYEFNRDAYTEAKSDFIKHYTDMARKEFPSRYSIE